jgi:hypothetical protein
MAQIPVPTSFSSREVHRFVRDLDRRLERLDRAILAAEWDLYTGRSSCGSERWQLQRGALLSDDRLLEWIRSALNRAWPDLVRRRLELLERVLLDTQVEQHPDVVTRRTALQRRIVAFRPRWNGKRVNRAVIHRVIREDPVPSHRRAAYLALEPLYRPMEDGVRDLIRIRNDRARALGFPSFAHMRLGFEGFTPSQIEDLATGATGAASGSIRRIRDRADPDVVRSGWHPWDLWQVRTRLARLPDRSFPLRTMLPTILRAIRQWGFRTERMRFRVVFHDLPSGGLTLAPDPPDDVRILVHPQAGWFAYWVMFHEVGHAVHSASIRAPRHLLRWHENVPGFGGFHEGIGGLFEEIAKEEEWLRAQPGIDPEQARSFAETWHDSDLLGTAQVVSWMRVEQALYRHPERDPMPEAHRFDRRLFGFDDYAALSFVDSFWVDTPCYAPNYLLAALFHYQIARSMREQLGEPLWPNPHVGPWLTRKWFAPGSLYDWVPRVRELTGRPFGASDFRAAFAGHRGEP